MLSGVVRRLVLVHSSWLSQVTTPVSSQQCPWCRADREEGQVDKKWKGGQQTESTGTSHHIRGNDLQGMTLLDHPGLVEHGFG